MVPLFQHQYIMEMKAGGGVIIWEMKSRQSLHYHSAYLSGSPYRPFYLYSICFSQLSQLMLKAERDNRNNLGQLLPLLFITDEKIRPKCIPYLQAVQSTAFLTVPVRQVSGAADPINVAAPSLLHFIPFCFVFVSWKKRYKLTGPRILKLKRNLGNHVN